MRSLARCRQLSGQGGRPVVHRRPDDVRRRVQDRGGGRRRTAAPAGSPARPARSARRASARVAPACSPATAAACLERGALRKLHDGVFRHRCVQQWHLPGDVPDRRDAMFGRRLRPAQRRRCHALWRVHRVSRRGHLQRRRLHERHGNGRDGRHGRHGRQHGHRGTGGHARRLHADSADAAAAVAAVGRAVGRGGQGPPRPDDGADPHQPRRPGRVRILQRCDAGRGRELPVRALQGVTGRRAAGDRVAHHDAGALHRHDRHRSRPRAR